MIEKMFKNKSRTGMIQTAGLLGILANALFAAVKLAIGTLANSVAIMSDAVNNLSDAVSSVVTLAGLKLSQRPPSAKHPLGFGRLEYISSLVISAIILAAGFEFLQTSFNRVLKPEGVSFTSFQFIVLFITLVGKLLLSRVNISVGKLADSLALQASGAEAMTDVIASAVTVAAAVLAKLTGINIDGWVGLLLAGFIIYTGFTQLKDTVSSILGERADRELVDAVRGTLKGYGSILGAYDFIVHNYGPTSRIASANLEFSDDMSVKDAYEVMYAAQREILKKYKVYFSFSFYAVNSDNEEAAEMKERIGAMLSEVPHVIGFHAFHVDGNNKIIRFDVVVDFTNKISEPTRAAVTKLVNSAYPDYALELVVDLDYA